MMKYLLTHHAQLRKKEYRISNKLIRDTLDKPSEISYDAQGHVMLKKLYSRRGHSHVFIIVGVEESFVFRIITIITSSKIKKYLQHE